MCACNAVPKVDADRGDGQLDDVEVVDVLMVRVVVRLGKPVPRQSWAGASAAMGHDASGVNV